MEIFVYVMIAVASLFVWLLILADELDGFSRTDMLALLAMAVFWPATWLAIGVTELMQYINKKRIND